MKARALIDNRRDRKSRVAALAPSEPESLAAFRVSADKERAVERTRSALANALDEKDDEVLRHVASLSRELNLTHNIVIGGADVTADWLLLINKADDFEKQRTRRWPTQAGRFRLISSLHDFGRFTSEEMTKQVIASGLFGDHSMWDQDRLETLVDQI